MGPTGEWYPANNGIGKRTWFVMKDHPTKEYAREYAFRADGRLRKFATADAAERLAHRLNTKGAGDE